MTDTFETWVSARGGFFRRSEALDCGYRDEQLRAATKSGHLVRLRHGYYAYADYVAELTDTGRYLLQCRAVLHRLGDDYALVGPSACAAHDIEMYGIDRSTVHVAHLADRRGRREAGVHFHKRTFDPATEVIEANGALATSPDLSLWMTACVLPTEGALVAMNSAFHRRIVEVESFRSLESRFERWSGSRTARIAFWLSDRRIESPGESRSFFLFWEYRLPRPEPQYKIYSTKTGLLVARTDFGWEKYRHVCEFDGKIKYMRVFRPDVPPEQIVYDEKCREDQVRDEDFGVSRLITPNLEGSRRPKTAYALMDAIHRSSRRYGTNRVTIAL